MEFFEIERKMDESIEEMSTLNNDIMPAMNHCLSINFDAPVDPDWLDNFLDDPVLNDCMMSDALQPVHVQSEHSYSLTNDDLQHRNADIDSKENDLDNVMLQVGNICKDVPKKCAGLSLLVKKEKRPCNDTDELDKLYSHGVDQKKDIALTVKTENLGLHTTFRPPTIILAAETRVDPAIDTGVFLTDNIKVEPVDAGSPPSSPEHEGSYDSIRLPPTPPSSNSSDSEGGLSPQRTSPSSPLRPQSLTRQQAIRSIRSITQSQHLFTSPIPTSGILVLSEEEKRTLISEGYPIPNKLPLTKQEEKNLKKIRRKIKNKISAQESRRKKKEYLETLEKKMETFNTENMDLRRKVDLLENNNRSLLAQLQKLQSLAGKLTSASPSPQTGTCLMIFVVFFAVFLGAWSPASLSIGDGYGMSHVVPQNIRTLEMVNNIDATGGNSPRIQHAGDPRAYETPSVRSRVLLSVREGDDEYGPKPPTSYQGFMSNFFSNGENNCIELPSKFSTVPPVPAVDSSMPINIKDTLVDKDGYTIRPSTNKNITEQITTSSSLVNNATS